MASGRSPAGPCPPGSGGAAASRRQPGLGGDVPRDARRRVGEESGEPHRLPARRRQRHGAQAAASATGSAARAAARDEEPGLSPMAPNRRARAHNSGCDPRRDCRMGKALPSGGAAEFLRGALRRHPLSLRVGEVRTLRGKGQPRTGEGDHESLCHPSRRSVEGEGALLLPCHERELGQAGADGAPLQARVF